MSAIRGLLEIVLSVRDLDKSVHFYRDVLGLTVISPPNLKAVFLQVGEPDGTVPQQIVLVPVAAEIPGLPGDGMVRNLHHIGLEIAPEDLGRERTRLHDLGFEVRTGEHPFLPVQAIYVDDPDGNEVELVAGKG